MVTAWSLMVCQSYSAVFECSLDAQKRIGSSHRNILQCYAAEEMHHMTNMQALLHNHQLGTMT